MTSKLAVYGAWSTLLALPSLFLAHPQSSLETRAAGGEARFTWGDYDADGHADAFVILASGQCGLLHGEGDGTLRDVTREAGLGELASVRSATWRPVAGTNALDLVVETRDGRELFQNVGGGSFSPTVAKTGTRAAVAPAAGGTGAQALVASGAGAQAVGPLQNLYCPETLVDQTTTSCIMADSTPTLGRLYPISEDLFVATDGRVGAGTTSPATRLHAVGRDATTPSIFDGESALRGDGGYGYAGGTGARAQGGTGRYAGGPGLVATGGDGAIPSAYGGEGGTLTGGEGYVGGVGAVVTGGRGEHDAGTGLVVTGGGGATGRVGGTGAIIRGAQADPAMFPASGGSGGLGAEITGASSSGYLGSGGHGVRVTGGNAGPLASPGQGIVATGGNGSGVAANGGTFQGGDGLYGGRGMSVLGGDGNNFGGTGIQVFGGNGSTGRAPAIEATGDVTVNGDLCATGTIGACSDERFKDRVEPLRDALATLLALRGVSYDWRTDEFPDREFSDERQVGFLAQEVLAVVPEVVTRDADGYYAVDYGRLTPLLVEALREQQARLDGQREELSALTARDERRAAELAELRAELASLKAASHGR